MTKICEICKQKTTCEKISFIYPLSGEKAMICPSSGKDVAICQICGREFVAYNGNKYCSKECSKIAKEKHNKEWREKNTEEQSFYFKQWYKTHRKQNRERVYQWQRANPEKHKALSRTYENRRRRNLDSIPLNKYFVGSEGHHIDKTHIIYIPKELHHSIPHNVFTGKNMDKINALAFIYLGEQNGKEE